MCARCIQNPGPMYACRHWIPSFFTSTWPLLAESVKITFFTRPIVGGPTTGHYLCHCSIKLSVFRMQYSVKLIRVPRVLSSLEVCLARQWIAVCPDWLPHSVHHSTFLAPYICRVGRVSRDPSFTFIYTSSLALTVLLSPKSMAHVHVIIWLYPPPPSGHFSVLLGSIKGSDFHLCRYITQ